VVDEVLVQGIEEQGECGEDPNEMLSFNQKPRELASFDPIDVLIDSEDVIQTSDQIMLLSDQGRNIMERDRERRE
jgi:hypothetical protein